MREKKKILLLIESSTAYGRKISQGISQFARERGDWILHIEDRGLFSIPTQLVQGWRGDGIIARTSGRAVENALKKVSCPIVELLSTHSGKTLEVMPDAVRGMELCVDHYLEKQLTSIAFYAFGRNWWIERRRQLFLEIAQRRHVRSSCFVDDFEGKRGPQPQWSERYEKSLVRWIRKLPPRTGIIAANDSQAMRVLNTCSMIEKPVPEEIAVLGMDNDEYLCNLVTPSLSSLDQNSEMIGYRAAELLDQKMKRKKRSALPIVVPPKGLVQRRSTGIASIEDADIAAALHFIAENAIHGIRISEVCKHVNLSHSTLCRRFNRILKRSPKDEMARIRIEHAKYLLSQTDLTIRAVASQSGFRTVEYFTAVFRNATGQTPYKYREASWKFRFSSNPRSKSLLE